MKTLSKIALGALVSFVSFCSLAGPTPTPSEEKQTCGVIVNNAMAVYLNIKSEEAAATMLEFELGGNGDVREKFALALHTARINKFNTMGEMRYLLMLECTH